MKKVIILTISIMFALLSFANNVFDLRWKDSVLTYGYGYGYGYKVLYDESGIGYELLSADNPKVATDNKKGWLVEMDDSAFILVQEKGDFYIYDALLEADLYSASAKKLIGTASIKYMGLLEDLINGEGEEVQFLGRGKIHSKKGLTSLAFRGTGIGHREYFDSITEMQLKLNRKISGGSEEEIIAYFTKKLKLSEEDVELLESMFFPL